MKLFALFVIAASCYAQVAAEANSNYKTPEGRAKLAITLLAHDRDQQQKPTELVQSMKLTPGMTVADIGTGAGYMIPFLKDAVGAPGKIIAEDIFPDFLEKAKARVKEKNVEGVTFIQGNDKDPGLPEAAIDAALVLDVYHHFDYPERMLAGIARGLKPGGRLVIVDFYKAGFRDPKHIRLDEADVIKEIQANGFELISNAPHTPNRQYIAIFRKK